MKNIIKLAMLSSISKVKLQTDGFQYKDDLEAN